MTRVELLGKDRFRFVWRLANGALALAAVEDVRAGGLLVEVPSAQELWLEGEAEGESQEVPRVSRDDTWSYDFAAVKDEIIVVEARHSALPFRVEPRMWVDEDLPTSASRPAWRGRAPAASPWSAWAWECTLRRSPRKAGAKANRR
jgi:hypothetical protein